MSQTINLSRSVFFQYIGSIAVLVLNFITMTIIVRAFSLKEYGEYSYLLSFSMLFQMVGNLGLPGIAQTYIPKYLSDRNLKYLISQLFWVKALSFLLISLVGGFFLLCFLEKYSDVDLIIFLGYIFFANLNVFYGDGIISLTFNHKYLYTTKIIVGFVKLTAIIFLNSNSNLSITLIFSIFLISEFISFFAYLYKTGLTRYRTVLHFANEKKHIKIFYSATFMSALLLPMIGVWFVELYQDIEKVALYCFLTGYGLTFVSAFSMANKLESIVVSYCIKKQYSVKDKGYMLGIQIWIKMSIIIMASLIISLWGNVDAISQYVFLSKYTAVVHFLPIFIFISLIAQTNYFYSPQIYLEKNIYMFKNSAFLAGIVHVLLLSIMSYFWSYQGAIASLLIAMLCKPIYYSLKFGVKKYFSISVLFIIKMLVISAITFYSSRYLSNYISSLWMTIIICCFSATLFFILSFLVKPFNIEERNLINSIIGKNIFLFWMPSPSKF